MSKGEKGSFLLVIVLLRLDGRTVGMSCEALGGEAPERPKTVGRRTRRADSLIASLRWSAPVLSRCRGDRYHRPSVQD